jgi:hypothetical protein
MGDGEDVRYDREGVLEKRQQRTRARMGGEDGAQNRKALVSEEDLGRTDKNVDLRFTRLARGCTDSILPLNHLFMPNSEIGLQCFQSSH